MSQEGKKPEFPYIHGFSDEEQERLVKQALFAEYTVYQNINFSKTKKLLEVGCGVGAQSQILLRRFPQMHLTGIDLSDRQLEAAKANLSANPTFAHRYEILKMDATKMSFNEANFDGAFLCWILEHVPEPKKVLSEVRRVLIPGSSIYITEVMNSSFFLDPYSPNTWKYWMAFNDFQYDQTGDPFIGAKLGHLLMQSGYRDIETTVKTWHLDNRYPQQRKEIIEYWTELLLSASEALINANYVSPEIVEGMKKEMSIVANDPDAVFFYSFIQAKAKV
ncbi:MAG: class I SAM-dependent methyltransferase [Pseudobdellovibrio sp.]